MELSEVHNCEKCRGKIVCVTVDDFGITRCGYCNKIVDYAPYFKEQLDKNPKIKNMIDDRNNQNI